MRVAHATLVVVVIGIALLGTAAGYGEERAVAKILGGNQDGLPDGNDLSQGAFGRLVYTVLGAGRASSSNPSSSFWGAFVNSVAMIIATEIGDKTFFIAAIMAMRYSRLLVFGGAVGALAVMTVLSAMMGFALPAFLPRAYTHYASALLFLYFGAKMIKEGKDAQGSGPSEELTEVEEELTHNKKDEARDLENGTNGNGNGMGDKTSTQVLWQAFTLTFLAEWGDRSQIATIALAAAKDPVGVTTGGIIGHGLCTGLAVVGGRMLAARISEKTVHLVGGALFLVFGVHSLLSSE